MNPPADRFIQLFNEANAIPAGAEREQFLAISCGEDAELRDKIEKLLRAHDEAGGFLKVGVAVSPELDAEFARLKPEQIGERIGHYKLLEQIGQGGFGTVWVAEQERPVRRRVALKIIKLGMDTREVIARFEQERQALAMMDHPNIAKVFDAGATDTGRPFFVMELVRGVKITEYCDQANLSTAERLQLFITVCQAVQHAHQKGIIHRDLKPSNVLVTLHDGVPVPKVIDFGVAKATEQQRLTDLTVYTRFEQMVGTPLYMSPEQAEMSGLDIDTRSDIYSLGVLLYELLTGRTPFDPEELMRQGLDEIRRTIREQEPQTPSMFVRTMALDRRADVARHRHADGAKLIGQIRGDLDWIVMKALEKERGRRYETANGLARDIERHLASEPVHARPTSLLYRFRRLVKRNKLPFAAGTAVTVALIGGLAISTWLFVRAEAARGEAERHLYAARMNLAQAAWEQANIDRLRQILEETRPYPDRGFEWFYWQRQLHLELRTLHGHTSRVRSVAFSPNGRRILTGSNDRTARTWDAETGRELVAFASHRSAIDSVAFSPDGMRILMCGGDETAKVCEAETGRNLLRLRGHASRVLAVAFSPDGGRILTGSGDKTAKLWDAETGRELLTLNGHTSAVGSVAFSSDGRRILTGSEDKTAKLWDAETGRELLTLNGHTSAVGSVAFSPEGRRILTGSGDKTARLWDAETGRQLLTLTAHSSDVLSVAFSPDGRWILTGSGDKTAKLWDADTGRELLTLKGHSWRVESVTFSPDGRRILTGSGDGTAKVWEAQIDREPLILKGHIPGISSASFSPDGRRILTGAYDLPPKTWDVETGREFPALTENKNHALFRAAFSPNGRWILTGGDGRTAKILDAETGDEILSLTGHSSWISSAAFSPDGQRLLTGSHDKTARIWDTKTGRELVTLRGHTNAVESVAFSPDGRRILTGSADKTAKLWDARTGRELLTLNGHTSEVGSVAFSSDSRRILTGSGDKTAKLWDARTGRELLTLNGHANQVSSVAFSSDGRRILTASADQTAKLWDATTGGELLTLKRHTSALVSAAFSPDGRRILTAGDTTATIWTQASGEEVEAWRKDDEANERSQKQRVMQAAPESDLDIALYQKNWNEAAAKLAVVEKLIPEERGAELELKRFKILMGQKAHAAAYELADKLSEAHPDNAELQNELAWEIVTDDSAKPRDLALAEKLAMRANDAAKGRAPSTLDTLARVLFIRGRKEEAIQLQNQAVTLAEDREKDALQKTLDSYQKGELPKAD